MRGELVTIALQGDFGKPRPALVIQSDNFSRHPTVTVIPITSALYEAPLVRFTLHPSKENGLHKKSQISIDKIQTVKREKISTSFGKISSAELFEIDRLLVLFLGLSQEKP